MKTFILYYNPKYHPNDSPSCWTANVRFLRSGKCNPDMNWAVADWKQAHTGDRFFLIMCGSTNHENDGVFHSGYFTSEPWRDEDWSGKGRDVHYMNIDYDIYLDPNYCPILSSNKLDLRIPHFDWHGGHSGRILDEESAKILEDLWRQHVEECKANPKMNKHLFDIDLI